MMDKLFTFLSRERAISMGASHGNVTTATLGKRGWEKRLEAWAGKQWEKLARLEGEGAVHSFKVLHDLQRKAVSQHPHGSITSRSFNIPINLLTFLQHTQLFHLGCFSKNIKNLQPTSAQCIWETQDLQPGRWRCTMTLNRFTQWILQSPGSAAWMNTVLLLTIGCYGAIL